MSAYLNHDLDDAIRSGVITRVQLPASCPGCWENPIPKGPPP
ncbi:MAG: hypothetical protein R2860_08090 [Desulfobacterales bacterium]